MPKEFESSRKFKKAVEVPVKEKLLLSNLYEDEVDFFPEDNLDVLDLASAAALYEQIERETNEEDTVEESYGSEVDDPVFLYFRDLGKKKLLTAEEEVSLIKRVRSGREAEKLLEIYAEKKSSRWIADKVTAVHEGREARDILITSNTRLVISIAKKYMELGVPFLDLIQEGNLGLFDAVEKFDYRKKFRFSTYATWWIRQKVTRALADQGSTIRIPVEKSDLFRRMRKAYIALYSQLGRIPTPKEIAATDKKWKVKHVKFMLLYLYEPLSLEAPVGEDGDELLGDLIEDIDVTSVVGQVEKNISVERLEEILNLLKPQEAQILRLRNGLTNGRVYTLEEISHKFKLTRERIRQIEKEALRHLRRPEMWGGKNQD